VLLNVGMIKLHCRVKFTGNTDCVTYKPHPKTAYFCKCRGALGLPHVWPLAVFLAHIILEMEGDVSDLEDVGIWRFCVCIKCEIHAKTILDTSMVFGIYENIYRMLGHL